MSLYQEAPLSQSSNPETVLWRNERPDVKGTNVVYWGSASQSPVTPSKRSGADILPAPSQ